MDYWEEAVTTALEEAGVVATAEQSDHITGSMEVSHEQHGMAHGHDVASTNLSAARDAEIATLRKDIGEQRDRATSGEADAKRQGERAHSLKRSLDKAYETIEKLRNDAP